MEDKKKPGRPKGSKNKTKRLTKSEVEKFISLSVDKIMDEHLSWTEYVKWAEKNGVSTQMANHYWKKSWKLVRDKYDLERELSVTKHLKKYWKIYDDAIDRGDLNTARHTLNDIAKLKGLNEPDRVEQTGIQTIKFNFGDEIDEK